MCFFRKKKAAVKNSEDREIIEHNSKSIDALLILAEENEEFKSDLLELKESIKYLVPSYDSKVIDADKKIRNLIGDLRIALTKSEGEDSKKTSRYFQEIRMAVADRNARL